MGGFTARIAVLAAVVCAALAAGVSPSAAAVEGVPDPQPALSTAQQTAAAIAAPAVQHALPAVSEAPAPQHTAPAPPPSPQSPLPSAARRAASSTAPKPGHTLGQAPVRPRPAAPAVSRAHARTRGLAVRHHTATAAPTTRTQRPQEPTRDDPPARLPGAMGAATAGLPGAEALVAALLMALLAASLPFVLRPLRLLALSPRIAAFVSPIERPG